jgi:hypothetical protein
LPAQAKAAPHAHYHLRLTKQSFVRMTQRHRKHRSILILSGNLNRHKSLWPFFQNGAALASALIDAYSLYCNFIETYHKERTKNIHHKTWSQHTTPTNLTRSGTIAYPKTHSRQNESVHPNKQALSEHFLHTAQKPSPPSNLWALFKVKIRINFANLADDAETRGRHRDPADPRCQDFSTSMQKMQSSSAAAENIHWSLWPCTTPRMMPSRGKRRSSATIIWSTDLGFPRSGTSG